MNLSKYGVRYLLHFIVLSIKRMLFKGMAPKAEKEGGKKAAGVSPKEPTPQKSISKEDAGDELALLADAGAEATSGVLRQARAGSPRSGTLLTRFSDFNIKDEVLQAIVSNGFESPSDVQSMAIPPALEHKDVICQAKSGKGKTAVFVLSLLHMIDPQAAPHKVQALILCNTHELAMQIYKEFARFAINLPDIKDKILCAIGGVTVSLHVKALKSKDVSIVVGTIGRMSDLMERGALDLSCIKYLVLDEFDALFKEEDNFKKITGLISKMPADHQTLLFTATFTEHSEKFARSILRDGYVAILVDDKQLVLTGLMQYYFDAPEEKKLHILLDCLRLLPFSQAVIFAKDISRVTALNEFLKEEGHECVCFFGKMHHKKREEVFQGFKDKKARILVSTDIFQRGVDFANVNLVIHYDMPDSSDAYLHRSGRAGRFETAGMVLLFVGTAEESEMLSQIQGRFATSIPQVQSPEEIDVKTAFTGK